MYKYRFVSQFLAINIAGIGFFLLAWINGWVARVIEADSSYVSFVILALFVFALISITRRVFIISHELDLLHSNTTASARLEKYRLALKNSSSASRALEIRMFSRITHIRSIGNGLVVLGLIGTVIGFILVAAEVNVDTAQDVSQVGGLVGALLHGMGVAFYTTLVGAIFSLWLSVNYQILHTGTALVTAAFMTEAGDQDPDELIAKET